MRANHSIDKYSLCQQSHNLSHFLKPTLTMCLMCNDFACLIQTGVIWHVVCLGFGQSGIWHCEPWQFEELSIWFLFPNLSVTVVTIVNFPLQSQSISSSNSVLVFDLSQSVFTQVFHLVSVRQKIIKLITVNTYYYVTKLERTYKPHYHYQNFSPLANGPDLNREKYGILQTHWH